MTRLTVLTTEDPDRRAVCATQAGDPDAFAVLVRRYSRTIYTLAVRVLGSRVDAEDAVQEIMLKAFRGLSGFDSSYRFFPWLYSIALNHLRSMRRRRGIRFRGEALELSEELLPAPESLEPEHQAVAHATREAVGNALVKLKPIQRRVFVLRQFQGLSTTETGAVLNIPENTVKTHLRRARERIAEILTKGET